METGNQKLIGQLSLGLDLLKTNIKDANKILEGISVKKLNLDIIDLQTKTKLLETTKLIKTEIEGMTKVGVDTTQLKSSISAIIKEFNSIQIKAREMKPIITETFSTIGNDAIKMSENQEKALNIVSTTWDKTGKKIVETKKAILDAKNNVIDYMPTSKVTTDDSSAKLLKISNAYKQLTTEQKTNENVMSGMANEVQKVIDKYGLQGQAYSTAATQALKYKTETEKIIQAEVTARNSVDEAISKTTKARETERLIQDKAQSSASNKYLEEQYTARVKATAQLAKQTEAIEKESLAELKLFTSEKSQTTAYDSMSRELSKISGEANLAMSSSSAGSSISDRFKVSAVYAGAAQSIFMLKQGVVNLIQTNRDYESSMVDLSRTIGNLSQDEEKAFGQDAISNAKKYGLALNDVQDSYTALAKAGVEKADISSMAKTVMLGLNTSDIKSGSEMTDLLTTSMKQLGIEMSKSESVLDGWNYLADKTVASTSDYANAVSKAGSSSKSIGVDLNELNGIVSVIIDKTGMSGNEAGTAIQSLETRLLRPKSLSTLKEYGIEVMKDKDHFKAFGDIIKETSDVLDKFGDNTPQSNEILDALGGTMRKNTINIVAKNYGQVDSYAKQSSVDSLGYSAKKSALEMNTLEKRIQIFNATVKELYIGAGSNGLVDQMKNIADFGTTIISVGSKYSASIVKLTEMALVIKGISATLGVIKGQNLTQMLDKIKMPEMNIGGASFGAETTSMRAYTSASAALSTQIAAGNIGLKESQTILSVVGEKIGIATTSTNTFKAAELALKDAEFASSVEGKALATEMEALKVAHEAASSTAKGQTASEEALSAAEKTTAASSWGLKLAMMGITLGLTLLVSGLIEGITYLTQFDERQAKALQDGADLAKTQSDQVKSTQDLVTQYQALSASGKTDTETKKQLLAIQTQLITSYGAEAKGLDLTNGKYKEQIVILQNAAKEKAADDLRTNVKSNDDASKAITKEDTYTFGRADDTTNRIASGEIRVNGTLSERVVILKDLVDKANSISDKTKTEQSLAENLSAEYKTQSTNLANAQKIITKMNSDKLLSTGDNSAKLISIMKAKSDIEKASTDGNSKGVKTSTDTYKTLYNAMEKTLSKNPELKKAFEDWAGGLGGVKVAAGEAGVAVVDSATLSEDALKALNTSYDASISNMTFYAKTMNEINSTGKLSSETELDILKNHKDLAPYLNNTAILYDKIKDSMTNEKNNAKTTYESLMMQDRNFAIAVSKNGTFMNGLRAQGYKTDFANASNVATAKIKLEAETIKIIAGSWAKYFDAQGTPDLVSVLEDSNNSGASMEDQQKVILKAQAMADKIKATNKSHADSLKALIPDIDFGKVVSGLDDVTKATDKGTKAKDENTEATDAQTEATARLKIATDAITLSNKNYETSLRKINLQMKEQDSAMSKLNVNGKEYIEGLDKKQKILQAQYDLTKKQMNLDSSLVGGVSALEGKAVATSSGNAIVEQAKKYLGTPYVWGGESTKGFDCSGLVQYVYKQLGKDIGRTTYDQVKEGTKVEKKDLKPGDVVFFGDPSAPHHEAIYAGDGNIIQAPQTGDVVKISKLSDRNDYATARRMMASSSSTSSIATGGTALPSAVLKYKAQLAAAGKKYGVNDVNLLMAIMAQESSGNGGDPMQASESIGLSANAIQDPSRSIDVGVKYIAQAIQKAGGNIPLGLQAYNYGDGFIDYAKQNGGYSQKTAQGFQDLHGGKGNYGDADYVKHVLKFYNGSGISGSGGGSSDTSASDGLLSSIDGYKSSLIDIGDQISNIAYEKLTSMIGLYDTAISGEATKITTLKNQLESTSNTDEDKVAINTEIEAQMRRELGMAYNKANYISTELKSNQYNQAQKVAMNVTLQEQLATDQEIVNQINEQIKAQDELNLSTQQTQYADVSKEFDQYSKNKGYEKQLLSSNDDIQKAKLMNDVLESNEIEIEITEEHLKRLNETVARSKEGQKALADEISSVSDKLNEQKIQAIADEKAINDLNITNALAMNDDKTDLNAFVLKNIEDSAKYNVKSTDNVGQMDILKQKNQIYADNLYQDQVDLFELSLVVPKSVEDQKALTKAIAEKTGVYRTDTEAMLDNKKAMEDFSTKAYEDNLTTVKSVEDKIVSLLKQKYTELGTLEDTRHTKALKDITDEQTAFDKFIEDKLKAIDDETNAEDYTKGLKKLVDEKAKTQAESDSLSLNSTQESVAQRHALELDLVTQQTAIDDYQSAHNLTLRKDALNAQKTANDKTVTDKNTTETTLNDANKKALEEDLKNAKINAEAQKVMMDKVYTDSTGQIVDLQTGLLKYEEDFGDGLTILGKKIKTELIDNLTKVNDLKANGFAGTAESLTTASVIKDIPVTPYAAPITTPPVATPNTNSAAKYNMEGFYADPEYKTLQDAFAIAQSNNDADSYNIIQAEATKLQQKYLLGYANGGLITEDQVALLHGENANSGFEAVLNEPQLKSLVADTTLQTVSNISSTSLPSTSALPSYQLPNFQIPNMQMPDMSQYQSSNQQAASNSFGSLLTVNGNIDAVTFPQVQKMLEDNVSKLVAASQVNVIKKMGGYRSF
ncbi:phage tail tape measure protein [Clostridium estertheticum]|uniref:phage tail tape measure protein n=1 Tax=Clostridium estertheticum TaxID=238834 RepID=UPI001C0CECE4|nr:phage tail tape measure protein [Clostridium estertheticum]MBU3186659.1 phage tail tape measure protein [Clostridium estertheticum]